MREEGEIKGEREREGWKKGGEGEKGLGGRGERGEGRGRREGGVRN